MFFRKSQLCVVLAERGCGPSLLVFDAGLDAGSNRLKRKIEDLSIYLFYTKGGGANISSVVSNAGKGNGLWRWRKQPTNLQTN